MVPESGLELWRAGREIDPGMGGEGETEYRKGNDHR